MAQMFSSGVTPDYLQALSDAYAQYFPQQAPVNTQALQQWYSPNGSSAFAASPATSVAPSSVVGSLFGEQYPQVRQGGGGSQMGQGVGNVGESAGFSGDFSGLASGLSTLGSMGMFGPLGKLASLAYGAYNRARPYGVAPSMSDAGLAAAIAGQDVANARDSADAATVGSGYGGGGFAGSDGVGRSAPGSAHL